MSKVLTFSIPLAKMQLMKALTLLAFATYSHAQCAACPSTVDDENLIGRCTLDIVSFTYCIYAWTDVCFYNSDGYILPRESIGNCPTSVGTTTDCIPC
ncbi:hypothetical protein EDC04DRAFT_2766498 [Pisolithus marmoratus]|nr:hypothetical protein EDC04DRAFT_2766498 [Pisolithus marmoratus]